MLFPKLISLNSCNFDFKECGFEAEKVNVVDKQGLSREGSGRAGIFKATGLPYVYTFECNYTAGVRTNKLMPIFDRETGKKQLKETNPIYDLGSAIYKNKQTPVFTPKIFKDIGTAFCLALLDLKMLNPRTRLISRPGENMEEALERVKEELRKEISKEKKQKKPDLQGDD